MQAPGFAALGAGVGRKASFIVEVKHLDARLAGVENGLVLVGTGHFALEAAGAFFGFELKRFEH
jgi:hypothetical protein